MPLEDIQHIHKPSSEFACLKAQHCYITQSLLAAATDIIKGGTVVVPDPKVHMYIYMSPSTINRFWLIMLILLILIGDIYI